jgi:DUF1680 family protein
MDNQCLNGPVDNRNSQVSLLSTLPIDSVHLHEGFWKKRQEVNHRVSLHHAYKQLVQNGSFDSFRRCAGMVLDKPVDAGTHEGHDTDIYKWLEGVAWEMARSPDEQLRCYIDETVHLIEAAQSEDGYLVTPIQLHHPERKWADLNFGHEMYCAGHLIQAAVALQRAVGDGRLLRVACRFADHIDSIFGPGKRSGTCGHPEIETALVELYRVTGSKRYLRLAQFLIAERGQRRLSGLASYGPEYHQDHAPVRESREAVGHAVRQAYLSTGVADFYMETGERQLIDTLNDLWMDIYSSKLYLTGGIGARFEGEAFGDPYELPTDQCYCETCAAIGNVMWNWRMLLITGERRFADLIERSMYNAILCCPSLDGWHYFYVNPLMLRESSFLRLSTNRPEATGFTQGRPEWHGVACCPPNVIRFLASLSHYFSTHNSQGIQVHQYANMAVNTVLEKAGKVGFELRGSYPWNGELALEIKEAGSAPWQLSLRIPGWCPSFHVEINGSTSTGEMDAKGYLNITRSWETGDTIRLLLDMTAQVLVSNPRVDATRGCAALQRGPVVYCFESHDQPANTDLLDIQIDVNRPVQAEWSGDMLDGVMVLHADGYVLNPETWGKDLYRSWAAPHSPDTTPVQLRAIPYYAWGNRGLKSMRVWVPRNDTA